MRLQLGNSDKTDETVVRFDNEATLAYDNQFDAYKMSPSADYPSISSSLSGVEYTINGIPFPQKSVSFPLVISTPADGSYTITANEISGLDNYKVSLTDKDQNFTANLTASKSYTFNSLKGKSGDRFILTIDNITTGIPENVTSKTAFNIYPGEGMINIQTLSDNWNGVNGEIRIFDLTGKLMLIEKNREFNSGDLLQVPVNLQNGIYLVEISAAGKRYVGKVFLK